MTQPTRSPRIDDLGWGRVDVVGHGRFKDVKLYPGGSVQWDWGETGTHHSPGIQPSDVEELLEQGATVIVLSQGVFGRLGVCDETLALLEDRGIETHVLRTRAAVELYNDLADRGEPVGGLIHTTC